MRTGSSLCRDATVEVIKNVKVTSPEDESEWEEKVNRPALALRKKFDLLSNGWSVGLVGMAGLCWLNALAFFTKALNEPYLAGIEAALGAPPGGPRIFNLVSTIILALLPFPLAADIAYTSSFCDHLMSELNEVRANYGPEFHLKIRCLEITLEKLVPALPPYPPTAATRCPSCLCVLGSPLGALQNSGQGLGFVLGSVVIDKRSLNSAAVKLIGALSTLFSLLLGLQEQETVTKAAGAGLCLPSPVQVGSIRAAMAERNMSCVYNMTLSNILDG